MKFNRRVGRKEVEGSGVLSNDDILSVMKVLIDIRNGKGTSSTTSTTSATVACARSARWPRTCSAWASCASSAPSRSA
jgi:hypothetical protein